MADLDPVDCRHCGTPRPPDCYCASDECAERVAADQAADTARRRRGHVPDLMLGRYRLLKRASDGALTAAGELARLGEHDLAATARISALKLAAAAHALRVVLDARTGA